MKHDPLTLTRPQLLDALRGYAHPSRYQQLCYRSTAALRGLLLAFQCPEDEQKAPERPVSRGPDRPPVSARIDATLDAMNPLEVLEYFATLAFILGVHEPKKRRGLFG